MFRRRWIYSGFSLLFILKLCPATISVQKLLCQMFVMQYSKIQPWFSQLMMLMMMMMMIMMNCFCGMVDRWKTFNLISSWENCQRFSTLRIFEKPQAGFELAQNIGSGFVEWIVAVLITITQCRCSGSHYYHHLLSVWIKLHSLP